MLKLAWQIRLVKGYFEDSVWRAREALGPIAVLRFDGDLYASTMDILYGLYDKAPFALPSLPD